MLNSLADHFFVGFAFRKQRIEQLFPVGFLLYPIAAVGLYLFPHFFIPVYRRDDGLLAGADNPLVKHSPVDDHLYGCFHIHVGVDDGLHVSLTDTIGGFPAGIGGFHHARPPGCHNDIDILHQQLCSLNTRPVYVLDEVLGSTKLRNAFIPLIDKIFCCLFSSRMRCNNNGVPALDCSHGICHRSDLRICSWLYGTDHAYRLGNFNNAGLLIFTDNSDRLFIFETVPHNTSFPEVLFCLVLEPAHAGFLHRHFRQLFSIIKHVFGNLPDNPVDLDLIKRLDFFQGLSGFLN